MAMALPREPQPAPCSLSVMRSLRHHPGSEPATSAVPAASRLVSQPHPKQERAKTCRVLRTNLLSARKCVTSAKLCAPLVKFVNPIGYASRSAT